jgi:hypothetical protein
VSEQRAFWQGVAAGAAAVLVAIHAWLALAMADMANMYRDMGSMALPTATRLVLSLPWRCGLPGVGFALLAALVIRRPRAAWPYAALAIALLLTVAASWHYSQAPLTTLADDIKD